MKKYVLLFSLIINYIFCYGDTFHPLEPYKKVSENREYFCWVDFNDNDTSKYEWKRKWILKVYDKDSVLFWQKEYLPSIDRGELSNDGKKFVCVEEWYYSDYPVVIITSKDNPDICIKGSEFNIPETSLIETVSHKLWLYEDYDYWVHLKGDSLTIFTIDEKTWIIDIETGVMALSEKTYWNLFGDEEITFSLFPYFFTPLIIGAMSVIKTIGNVRRKRLFFRTKYKNNTKKRTLKR